MRSVWVRKSCVHERVNFSSFGEKLIPLTVFLWKASLGAWRPSWYVRLPTADSKYGLAWGSDGVILAKSGDTWIWSRFTSCVKKLFKPYFCMFPGIITTSLLPWKEFVRVCRVMGFFLVVFFFSFILYVRKWFIHGSQFSQIPKHNIKLTFN